MGRHEQWIDPMKQNVLAVILAFSAVALVGCAGMQQQLAGIQQPAQQAPQANVNATNGQAQAATQQQQPQESIFLGDLIKTATETIGSEAKSAVRSTIQGAGSAIRN